MPHYGAGVEYALHSLILLAGLDAGERASAREIAAFHSLSGAYVAKLMTRLAAAGLVDGNEGAKGGWQLARPSAAINVLEVADAIEGRAPIFECRNIRANCILFGGNPPKLATSGICSVHAVMLGAEKALRDNLAGQTIADIAGRIAAKAPGAEKASSDWFRAQARVRHRGRSRTRNMDQ